MLRRLILFFNLIALSANLMAGPQDDAQAQFEKFFANFVTDNQDGVTELFSDDAIFLGTISPEPFHNKEGIREYFRKALARERGETIARVFSVSSRLLSNDVVLIEALWQSERTLNGEMTTRGPSRNTSVMHKRGAHWFIVQFHNSWVPK